jgi:hypothetical protein
LSQGLCRSRLGLTEPRASRCAVRSLERAAKMVMWTSLRVVLAIKFSKILGSARKKSMERPCQCQLFPFRFERPKDPMTFLANEQTRMSSSQSSPDDLTRPRVGVFLSRAIDPPFLPCVSKVRQIYRPALLPAWTFSKEGSMGRCLTITPHVVYVHWKRGICRYFVVGVCGSTHLPLCTPYL